MSLKWADGAFATREVPVPDLPSAFEVLVASLDLQDKPELWIHSAKIRAFAKRNRKIRYVPEELLAQLSLEAEVED